MFGCVGNEDRSRALSARAVVFVFVLLLLSLCGSWTPQAQATNSEPSTYALNFDGATNYVTIATPVLGTDWTIEAWVNVSNVAENTIYAETSSSSLIPYKWLETSLNGELLYNERNDSSVVICDCQGVKDMYDGLWHHVVALNNETLIQFYIDGEYDTEAPREGGTVTIIATLALINIYITG